MLTGSATLWVRLRYIHFTSFLRSPHSIWPLRFGPGLTDRHGLSSRCSAPLGSLCLPQQQGPARRKRRKSLRSCEGCFLTETSTCTQDRVIEVDSPDKSGHSA